MQTPHTGFPQADPAGSAAAEQGTMPVARSEFERLTAAEQDQLIGVAVDAVSKRLTELNNDDDGVGLR